MQVRKRVPSPLLGGVVGFERGQEMTGKFPWGAFGRVQRIFPPFPEARQSALGRVLGSILRETGRQERNKGS